MSKVNCFVVGLLLCAAINKDVLGKHHERQTKAGSGGKIVGGYNTTIQDAPYQAYLLLQKGIQYYQCGGSIISSKVVLTAAHCLTGVSTVYVRIGSTDSDRGGTQYTTSLITIHPRYNPATSDYDVGIVRVATGMKLDGTSTKAVSLPSARDQVKPETNLLVTGWGTTTENGETSSNLMAVNVPTVSTEDCRKAYGQNSITERMVCAGLPEGGKDSCQGDSGGPAVDTGSDKQIGIVSFGSGCARAGYPGVYTNVSSVRTWIRRNARV